MSYQRNYFLQITNKFEKLIKTEIGINIPIYPLHVIANYYENIIAYLIGSIENQENSKPLVSIVEKL